jgi:hypothetical protein
VALGAHSDHLGMRGGIFQCLHLVVRAGNNTPLMHNDGSDRDFLPFPGTTRLSEGFAHKILVTVEIDQWFV